MNPNGIFSAGIAATVTGYTLDNVNNTISGSGTIGGGVAFDNQTDGTVLANASYGTLALNAAGQKFSNEGLMEAANGGILQIGAGTGRLFGFGDVASTVSGGSVVAQGQGDTLTLALGASGAALSAQAGATLELADSSSARAVSVLGAPRLDGVTLTRPA